MADKYTDIILLSLFFLFNATATTEIYTLSLHDALPIYVFAAELREALPEAERAASAGPGFIPGLEALLAEDRKSTRLNSSHVKISYAVFCLKKKKRDILMSAMSARVSW